MSNTPGNTTSGSTPLSSSPTTSPGTLPGAITGTVFGTDDKAQPPETPLKKNPGATPGGKNAASTPSTTSGVMNQGSAGPEAASVTGTKGGTAPGSWRGGWPLKGVAPIT